MKINESVYKGIFWGGAVGLAITAVIAWMLLALSDGGGSNLTAVDFIPTLIIGILTRPAGLIAFVILGIVPVTLGAGIALRRNNKRSDNQAPIIEYNPFYKKVVIFGLLLFFISLIRAVFILLS